MNIQDPPIPRNLDGIDRDPDAAAREMGEGNRTVLPSPMLGDYTSWSVSRVVINFDVEVDTSPVLVERLLDRLKMTNDEIVYEHRPGSSIAARLLEAGFQGEIWGGSKQMLVWRAPS
jgi:hypothetical protein